MILIDLALFTLAVFSVMILYYFICIVVSRDFFEEDNWKYFWVPIVAATYLYIYLANSSWNVF